MSVILGAIVYIAIQYEFSRFAIRIKTSYQNAYLAISLLLLPLIIFGGFSYFCFGLAIVSLLLFAGVICIIEREPDVVSLSELLLALGVGVAYIGVLGSILPYALLKLPTNITIWTVVVVSVSDTAAFFGGSFFGGRKLAPRISPNKTVSGMISGIVVSFVVGVLLGNWFLTELPIYFVALSAIVVSISGIFGDLAESVVKRTFSIKDSSSLLPGHGGVLDRVDALLFAVPCALLLVKFSGVF
ncbi:UNVERIFIED_CONTAM: hypothetical protein GTU68_059408 [Idotea baltica]|nr:hypothetical protein [Idotea baltica]